MSRKVLISVIIPVGRITSTFPLLLERLVKHNIKNIFFEIIIVNNSSGYLGEKCEKIISEYHPRIKIYRLRRPRNPAAARNYGILRSSGKLIVFLDADVLVPKYFLECIRRLWLNSDIKYVGFKIKVKKNGLDRMNLCYLYDRLTSLKNDRYISFYKFAATCALMVEKDVINRVGMFDERLYAGEDFEFGNRVYAAGIKLSYNPYILIYHQARNKISLILKKAFKTGFSFGQLSILYPSLDSAHSLINSLRFRNFFPLFRIEHKTRAVLRRLGWRCISAFYILMYFTRFTSSLGYWIGVLQSLCLRKR